MDSDRYDDVFCVDCDGYRKQKLKGRNNYDGEPYCIFVLNVDVKIV